MLYKNAFLLDKVFMLIPSLAKVLGEVLFCTKSEVHHFVKLTIKIEK